MIRFSSLKTAVFLISSLIVLPASASWYVGVGAGDGNVDSDTVPPTSVPGDNGSDRANDELPWKVFVGRAGEPFSVEVFSAYFGELNLEPAGELERRVNGIVGRKSLLGSHCDRRSRFDLSAALGVGYMSSHYTDATARNGSSAVLVGGLAASVRIGAGVAVRADYDYYDRDTNLTSLSVLKQFGRHGGGCAHHADKSAAHTVASTESVSSSETSGGTTTTTSAGAPGGQFSDIQFNPDSSFLTDRAEDQVGTLTRLMAAYPGLVLEVQGHSDSAEWGGSEFGLSAERARSVATALAGGGVQPERLMLSGYADSRPVASNGDRALNRRVQFRILTVR